MLMQSVDIPIEMQNLYDSESKIYREPTTWSMVKTLEHMMDKFNHVYIMIDALDECEDVDELLGFIKTMTTWEHKAHHVLVTSRKEKEIEDSLGITTIDQICIQSGLIDPDIRTYLGEKLLHDVRLNRWPKAVQHEIEDSLMDRAAGM